MCVMYLQNKCYIFSLCCVFWGFGFRVWRLQHAHAVVLVARQGNLHKCYKFKFKTPKSASKF
jgi:hypothetical protein